MKKNGFWEGREDNLFAIALSTAVAIGAAVPTLLPVRLAISVLVFVFSLWLLGRYPVIILRAVTIITHVNPTIIRVVGILITAGLAALVFLSPGSAHHNMPVGLLAYMAAAIMTSLVIGLAAAALRHGGDFPPRSFISLLIVLVVADAFLGQAPPRLCDLLPQIHG